MSDHKAIGVILAHLFLHPLNGLGSLLLVYNLVQTVEKDQQVLNPVQVMGGNTAFAGKRAVLQILDQDRTQVSQAISVTGETHFSASVAYTSNFQGEAQEGIVALYIYNGNQMIVGAAMVKVLLSA